MGTQPDEKVRKEEGRYVRKNKYRSVATKYYLSYTDGIGAFGKIKTF